MKKTEQFLVHQRLGALQQKRKIILRNHPQTQQILLIEEMIRGVIAQARLVELGSKLRDRAAGHFRDDEKSRKEEKSWVITEKVYERAYS